MFPSFAQLTSGWQHLSQHERTMDWPCHVLRYHQLRCVMIVISSVLTNKKYCQVLLLAARLQLDMSLMHTVNPRIQRLVVLSCVFCSLLHCNSASLTCTLVSKTCKACSSYPASVLTCSHRTDSRSSLPSSSTSSSFLRCLDL